MNKRIKILLKEPGKMPKIISAKNTLKCLQELCGGYIETLTLGFDTTFVVNENGVINDLPYNCTVSGQQLFGNVLLVGVKDDEFTDLPFSLNMAMMLFPGLLRR